MLQFEHLFYYEFGVLDELILDKFWCHGHYVQHEAYIEIIGRVGIPMPTNRSNNTMVSC